MTVSFLEYLNKKVLKDFGLNDFKLEDNELESLHKYRDNYRSFKWISMVAIIIALMAYTTLVLQSFEVIPNNYNSLVNGVTQFFIIMALNAVIARMYSQSNYEKYIQYIKGKGFKSGMIKISPHNCINYGEGKFIMLENDLVNELGKGELDVTIPLKEPDKVITLNMEKVSGDKFTCDLEFDINTQSVKIKAYAPEDMYEEFHTMCINGKGKDN